MLIYAGFLLVTAGSDDEQLKKTKQILIYTAIGFLILVASHAIISFFFLEVPNQNPNPTR